jgi:flagellar FliL protein
MGKKKKGGKLVWGVAVAILILLCAVGGFTYFAKSAGGNTTKESAKGSSPAEKSPSVMFPLDTLIVNLTDRDPSKYLKVSMQLELASATPDVAKTKTAQIKDAVISILSSKAYSDLISPEGKLQLKDEITLAANQVLGNNAVKNVFFTDLAMQ